MVEYIYEQFIEKWIPKHYADNKIMLSTIYNIWTTDNVEFRSMFKTFMKEEFEKQDINVYTPSDTLYNAMMDLYNDEKSAGKKHNNMEWWRNYNNNFIRVNQKLCMSSSLSASSASLIKTIEDIPIHLVPSPSPPPPSSPLPLCFGDNNDEIKSAFETFTSAIYKEAEKKLLDSHKRKLDDMEADTSRRVVAKEKELKDVYDKKVIAERRKATAAENARKALESEVAQLKTDLAAAKGKAEKLEKYYTHMAEFHSQFKC